MEPNAEAMTSVTSASSSTLKAAFSNANSGFMRCSGSMICAIISSTSW